MEVKTLEVLGKIVFTNFLMGDTMQDGGKRERSIHFIFLSHSYFYFPFYLFYFLET